MGGFGKFEGIWGASQNRGAFLATSGELHWDAQPTTLDNPKSGMHPAFGVYPGFLARFSPYLVSYAGCGRDIRDPRGIFNNLGCTRSDCRTASFPDGVRFYCVWQM